MKVVMQVTDRSCDPCLAEQFSRDLYELTKRKNKSLFVISNNEYGQLLELSKVIMEMDWSKDSRVKESLKKKLEAQMFTDEIRDDELDWVAGGLQNPEYSPFDKNDKS